MQQQQEIATDRLVSVIQTIQLRRGTGVLKVRRGEGITSEEGVVEFVSGKVAGAKVGRRTGSDALNFLSTWGSCLFVYNTANVQESMWFGQNVPPSMPQTDTQSRESFTPISPLRKPLGFPSTEERSTAGQELFPHPAQPNPVSDLSSMMPYHTRPMSSALRILDNMGFSRTYRQIFLLVDGHRTVLEIMRLTGRNYDEISKILHELERATVIRLPE